MHTRTIFLIQLVVSLGSALPMMFQSSTDDNFMMDLLDDELMDDNDLNNSTRTDCFGNFTCIYRDLELGLMSSKDFDYFSRVFLLNDQGHPTFVYINVNISWLTCDDNTTTRNFFNHDTDNNDALFVWGRSPIDALFGPVQEAFYFGAFDPFIMVGSMTVDKVLRREYKKRRDILLPWLSVDYPKVSISMEKACFNTSEKQGHLLKRDIAMVLLQLFRKSQGLASGNQILFRDGYVVHYADTNALLVIAIVLHYWVFLSGVMVLIGMNFIFLQKLFCGVSAETKKKIPDSVHCACGFLVFLHAIVSVAIIVYANTYFYFEPEDNYKKAFGSIRSIGKDLFFAELEIITPQSVVSCIFGFLSTLLYINESCKRINTEHNSDDNPQPANCSITSAKVAKITMYNGIGIFLWIIFQQLVPLTIRAIIAPLATLTLMIQYICTLVITVIMGLIVFSLITECITCQCMQRKKFSKLVMQGCIITSILFFCLVFITCFTLLSGVGVFLGIETIAITGVFVAIFVSIIGGVASHLISHKVYDQNWTAAVLSQCSQEDEDCRGDVPLDDVN